MLRLPRASFFPIPPDVLLMAMSLGKPKRAFYYAAVCTAGSVLGGLLGFYIGVSLWRTLGVYDGCPGFEGGAFLFQYVPGFTCEQFAKVQELYQANAWLALFTAAFTPIPYKVFTIAAGVFQVAVPTLIFASVVGRGRPLLPWSPGSSSSSARRSAPSSSAASSCSRSSSPCSSSA
ncbi:MAG: VTT domain-containing protein, partial [Sandaracinaceae bacterium]|nr:VTT domain-containing protein [Sandaracinaceae bacterium]